MIGSIHYKSPWSIAINHSNLMGFTLWLCQNIAIEHGDLVRGLYHFSSGQPSYV